MKTIISSSSLKTRQLTEDEADLLHKLADKYWQDFSKLVGKTLEKAPPELQDALLYMLEDKSSCHGSDFIRYMKKAPPGISNLMRSVHGEDWHKKLYAKRK